MTDWGSLGTGVRGHPGFSRTDAGRLLWTPSVGAGNELAAEWRDHVFVRVGLETMSRVMGGGGTPLLNLVLFRQKDEARSVFNLKM